MGSDAATALAQAASGLRESARTHKRLSQQHRRQAKALLQQLDQLERDCAELGITLQLETPDR